VSSVEGLIAELDRWRTAGIVARFWWRDDDAISATPALERLLNVVGDRPIAVAVVPRDADDRLATRLEMAGNVDVLQHGWAHQNHANEPPNSEYPAGRSADQVSAEIRDGRARLLQLFGRRALPVFVPPWHGFHDGYFELLNGACLTGFSSKGARSSPYVHELTQVNIHCVPIAWTSPPSFGDPEPFVSQLCTHLEGRRTGRFDRDEPTGVLTHHLVQDEASYAFIRDILAIIDQHPAATWASARELFRLT